MALYDETDVATLVRSRELADGMMRELSATMPRAVPITPPPPALEPEELLPPPPSLPPSNIYEQSWSTTLPIAAAPAVLKRSATTMKKPLERRKARSHLHWAVLAMSVAIAVGLWRDPIARGNAKRQITSETHRVAKSVSATAKRVSARVI